MTAQDALLAAENLSVQLNGQLALDRIDLSIKEGEILTVIGPNGAGKTTLLRALLGLQRPNAGCVRRKSGLRVGYMPQHMHISPALPLTVSHFLNLSAESETESHQALTRTGTAHLKNRSLSAVSGGEFQRILLGRALLARPDLLVLDEPAQGVDIQGQTELYRLIGALRSEQNCAVLMVSHDLHLVMATTDTVICLNRHVCCQGHPEVVQLDPAYLDLFGPLKEPALAVYAHHHDHNHNLHGDVRPLSGDKPRA